jgi:hypothetical protein
MVSVKLGYTARAVSKKERNEKEGREGGRKEQKEKESKCFTSGPPTVHPNS